MFDQTPIPRFYLYGEPHRVADGNFVHVENLDDRSRPSEWTIRPHAHAELNHIFHIVEGGGGMVAEGSTMSFEAPCIILVPAGIVHGFSWTSESTGVVVTLSTDYLNRLHDCDPGLSGLFRASSVATLDKNESRNFAEGTSRLISEVSWAAPGHRAATQAALLDLLVKSLRVLGMAEDVHHSVPGHQAALVARFRERIEARFRLRESVSAYTDALHTSQTRLRAACAVIAQRSPMQILDQRCFVEAQRLLLYTNLSVREVANSVGFDDTAYFSRFFSRNAGMCPRTYRDRSQHPTQ